MISCRVSRRQYKAHQGKLPVSLHKQAWESLLAVLGFSTSKASLCWAAEGACLEP